ncbi:hypothetical protein [Salimicrobium halophilum]|uniref:Uncharacterized protein n=1 Tax=Salimicrobium halophilum TaxID=86666 RepID=A0A1G8WF78_9BACI|nr:hypothetical protein [Salimicrobium halophilum]SDJ76737.1 hypothetical protein SAMN04490247_3159 [Salimicrobium halophilum]
MTTNLAEALRNIGRQFMERVNAFSRGLNTRLRLADLQSDINAHQSRLTYIEKTVLPATKHSVRRKKLLQEQKHLKATIQELRVRYSHLRNQEKRKRPIKEDEIDTAILNLKGWGK